MQEQRLENKNDFILTETHWNSFFTNFFINMVFFIYIPAILWDFSYFILLLKTHKIPQLLIHVRTMESRKIIDTPLPKFSLKTSTESWIYLTGVTFGDILFYLQSTKT